MVPAPGLVVGLLTLLLVPGLVVGRVAFVAGLAEGLVELFTEVGLAEG